MIAAPAATVPAPVAARPAVLGRSAEDRPIRLWRVGDPRSPRRVLVVGSIHGTEPAGRAVIRALRRRAAPRGVELWLIDTANPDGSAAGTRQNAHGVDLNRNFPVRWRDLDGPYESGPHPKSEPEKRAIMRFLRNVRPDRMISLHQPLFKVDVKSSKNPRFSRRVARNMRIPIGNVDCGGVCHGTMTQWFNRRTRGASITVELAAHPSEHYVTKVGPNGLLRAVYGDR